MRNLHTFFIISACVFLLNLDTAGAANFFPTSVEELIEDIQTANSNNQADDINLVPGMVYTITGNEPGVPFNNGNGNTGLPLLLGDNGNPLTINGNGATIERDPSLFSIPDLPCSGDGLEFRIFELITDAVLILNDMTLRNGCGEPDGGAIFSVSSLTLININNVNVVNNEAQEDGGGIATAGDLAVDESDVSHNSAIGEGGGISIVGSECTLIMTDSTVNDNSTGDDGDGGGIYIEASIADIRRSEINGNMTGFEGNGAGMFLTANSNVQIRRTDINENIGGGNADGGGIHILESTVMIDRSNINDNESSDGGGIFSADALVTLTDSLVHGNDTGFGGGGIRNVGSGDPEFTISGTTISNNQAASGSGVSHAAGLMKIYHSAIVNNGLSTSGGGITNTAELEMLNVTVSGNEAIGGGGLNVLLGTVTMDFVTIANNTASNGGGFDIGASGTVNFRNSLVAGNTATSDDTDNCDNTSGGTINDNGGNISDQIFDGCGVFFDGFFITPTMLGSLANNGGGTLTHALNTTIPPNPAIDNIAIVDCTDKDGAPVITDQRGFQRPFPGGGNCDTGAFEAQPFLQAINNIPVGEGAFFIKRQFNKMKVIDVAPKKKIFVVWGFKSGNGKLSGTKCDGTQIDIKPSQLLASLKANSKGIVNKKLFIPSTS